MVMGVCLTVAILSAVFCVICSLLMFGSDVSGDHMVRSQTTRGGTVWQQQMPHIEINSYPESSLFISTGFLPRVSSKRLN